MLLKRINPDHLEYVWAHDVGSDSWWRTVSSIVNWVTIARKSYYTGFSTTALSRVCIVDAVNASVISKIKLRVTGSIPGRSRNFSCLPHQRQIEIFWFQCWEASSISVRTAFQEKEHLQPVPTSHLYPVKTFHEHDTDNDPAWHSVSTQPERASNCQ